jgi:hypothetical protein
VTFFDVANGLEAARKYVHKFEIEHNINAVGKNVENEPHILRTQGKKKQVTIIDWLNK